MQPCLHKAAGKMSDLRSQYNECFCCLQQPTSSGSPVCELLQLHSMSMVLKRVILYPYSMSACVRKRNTETYSSIQQDQRSKEHRQHKDRCTAPFCQTLNIKCIIQAVGAPRHGDNMLPMILNKSTCALTTTAFGASQQSGLTTSN